MERMSKRTRIERLQVFIACCWAGLAVLTLSQRALAADYNVSVSTCCAAYTINTQANPTLFLTRGRTYTFAINATGHPFYIQTASGTSSPQYSTGVTGNGTASGTLTFAVPANAPAALYYQCGVHAPMTGQIQISGCATPCGDACNTSTCNNANGTCSANVPKQNGTTCDDNNLCTGSSSCQSGVCVGQNPVVCTASNNCHNVGTCDPATGVCSNPVKPENSSCSDGNACTSNDHCQSGTCTSTPIQCNTPGTCELSGGSCSGGTCSYPAAPAGSACNTDPNLTGQTCDGSRNCTGGQPNSGGVYLWGQMSPGSGSSGSIGATPTLLTGSGMNNLVSVAVGSDHILALDVNGSIWGWGNNSWGAVNGQTSPASILTATLVFTGAVGVAAGNGHTIILGADGVVRMWGILGNATLSTGGVGVISIAAGGRHGVALTADGKVWTWGYNGDGELGNGTYVNSYTTAVSPTLPKPARAVAAGDDFTLALLADGTVYAWGANYNLEIAQPASVSASNRPLQIAGLSNVRAIAGAGWHGMALLADGTIKAWGDNTLGELGNGTVGGMSSSVVPVSGLSRVLAISANFFSSLALRADGSVWTWGGNSYGELGNPALAVGTSVPTAQQVPSLSGVSAISGGSHSVAAVKATGWVKSFGSNANGELGVGQTSTQLASSNIPLAIVPLGSTALPPFKAVSSSSSMHRLALASDGTVWAWGSNQYGELGTTGADSPNPVKVSGISDVIAVYAGDYDSMALRADGTLWAWGSNIVGNLGNGTTSTTPSPTPTQVPGLANVIEVAARNNTLAIKADGQVYAWGWNRYFQCGTITGPTTSPRAITLPASSPYARSAAAGTYNSYILLANGTIAAIGRNDSGQLGTGATSDRTATPQIVQNLTGVSAISAGLSFALALTHNFAYGWGVNTSGQLATAASPVLSPVYLPGTYFQSIAAGLRSSYFVTFAGTAYAMGSNTSGALGTGSTASTSSSFTQLNGGTSVLTISAGNNGAEMLLQ